VVGADQVVGHGARHVEVPHPTYHVVPLVVLVQVLEIAGVPEASEP